MKKQIVLLLLCVNFSFLSAQLTDYSDVGVIINDNSILSGLVGSYYQTQHNIPAVNMIHVNVDTSETIDSLEFENLRQQVENYLTTNNIVDSLNYLVTTKGVPLIVQRRGPCDLINNHNHCGSVTSELGGILGPFSNSVNNDSLAPNPFWSSQGGFSKTQYGTYLTARLDGASLTDIYGLISRGGPGKIVHKPNSRFIFDYQNCSPNEFLFNDQFLTASDTLISKGWPVKVDSSDTNQLIWESDVLGYWEINLDSLFVPTQFNWLDGSVVLMENSLSAFSFSDTFHVSGPPVWSIIRDGATCIGSSITFSFATPFFQVAQRWFKTYISENESYNSAESFWKGISSFNSEFILIGDPKTSLQIDTTVGTNIEADVLLKIFPNPTTGQVFIQSDHPLESIKVCNTLGQIIFEGKTNENNFEVDLTNQAAGMYVFLINTKQGSGIFRLIKE